LVSNTGSEGCASSPATADNSGNINTTGIIRGVGLSDSAATDTPSYLISGSDEGTKLQNTINTFISSPGAGVAVSETIPSKSKAVTWNVNPFAALLNPNGSVNISNVYQLSVKCQPWQTITTQAEIDLGQYAQVDCGDIYSAYDPAIGTAGIIQPFFPAWSSSTTYSLGQFVTASGVNYVAIQGANLNNAPASSPTFWVIATAVLTTGPLTGATGSTVASQGSKISNLGLYNNGYFGLTAIFNGCGQEGTKLSNLRITDFMVGIDTDQTCAAPGSGHNFGIYDTQIEMNEGTDATVWGLRYGFTASTAQSGVAENISTIGGSNNTGITKIGVEDDGGGLYLKSQWCESLTICLLINNVHSGRKNGSHYDGITMAAANAAVFAVAEDAGVAADSYFLNNLVAGDVASNVFVDKEQPTATIEKLTGESALTLYARSTPNSGSQAQPCIWETSVQAASVNCPTGNSFENVALWPALLLPAKLVPLSYSGAVTNGTQFMTTSDVAGGIIPFGVVLNGDLAVATTSNHHSVSVIRHGIGPIFLDGPSTANDVVVLSSAPVIGTAIGGHDSGSSNLPGSGTYLGYVRRTVAGIPTTPSAPTVTTSCASACTTTWSYEWVIMNSADPADETQSAPSSAGTVSGPSTLSTSSGGANSGFNSITSPTGCSFTVPCRLYRTVGGVTGFVGEYHSTATVTDKGMIGNGLFPVSTGMIAPPVDIVIGQGGAPGSFNAGGDLSGSSSSQQVIGLKSVPLCTGFTPTNTENLQYTTTSSPNPCWSAAPRGASTALNNLAGVSINQGLLPVSGLSLGSSASQWEQLFLYGGGGVFGSNYFVIGGAPTGARTVNFPDVTGGASILAAFLSSATITNGDCVDWVNTAGSIWLGDTGSPCGSGGGGGVSTFTAPSGSWPTWLVPTVTNATTTPSLAVAASAIPNAALANVATTVNGQTCTLGSTCTIPFTTNSAPNSSQNGIDFITSTTNAIGLTVTPVNSGPTKQERFEITGTYTGTASGLTGCSPSTAGDLCYWTGSAWLRIAGNASGTQYLQETSSGVPSWATPAGSGTVNSGTVDGAAYYTGSTAVSSTTAPTTTGHTFVLAWQPSGSAIAPAPLDLATYLASPPAIGGSAPNTGAFTNVTATGSVGVGASPPTCTGASIWCAAEQATANTSASGVDTIQAISGTHQLEVSLNAVAPFVSLMNFSTVNLASSSAGGVTGNLPNANLANPATTPNGQTCTLGSTCNVNSGAAAHSVSLNEGSGSAIAGATIGTGGRVLVDQGAAADPAFKAVSQDASMAANGALTVLGLDAVPFCSGFTPTNGQLIQYTTGGSPNPCYTAATGSGGGDTISSPNGTIVVGGTILATQLDLAGAAGEIMAGATPALTYTPVLGVASSHTGTLGLANAGGTGVATLGVAVGSVAATVTVPDSTDTLVNLAGTQTLTNKSISGAQINSGTVPCAQQPALTGNVTTSAGSCATTVAAAPLSAVTGLGTGVATALAVNTGTAGAFGVLIASGTAAMNTGAVASGACETVVMVSATGVATTDTITVGFNGDPTAVTGYGASATGAVLSIYPYPTSGNVNFKVCNSTSASITPGALTLNWRVVR
jgi:hypothetical protein